MRRRPSLFVFGAQALCALAMLAPHARAADDSLEQRLAERAPAIVTVKAVLADEDYERTTEVQGVVVDPSGTVMVSSTMLGDSQPRRLHVLFGSDAKENPAVLVARDTNLRVSFVQVLDVANVASVDLGKGATPKIGQDLFGVTRSGRGFDFTPEVQRLYVTGKLEKPRPLWDFAGDFMERGLPVFDLTGVPVGVIVDQPAPSGIESEGDESEIFILPLEAITKSLDAARRRIPEAVERARKAAESTETKEPPAEGAAAPPPAPGEKPPEPPKPPETPKPPEQPPR